MNVDKQPQRPTRVPLKEGAARKHLGRRPIKLSNDSSQQQPIGQFCSRSSVFTASYVLIHGFVKRMNLQFE
ncbi:hypothetical protein SprV_0200599100 [Sparganum proliferum]